MRKSEAYPSKYFKAKDFPDDWAQTFEVEMARMEEFPGDNGKKNEKLVTYFKKREAAS